MQAGDVHLHELCSLELTLSKLKQAFLQDALAQRLPVLLGRNHSCCHQVLRLGVVWAVGIRKNAFAKTAGWDESPKMHL